MATPAQQLAPRTRGGGAAPARGDYSRRPGAPKAGGRIAAAAALLALVALLAGCGRDLPPSAAAPPPDDGLAPLRPDAIRGACLVVGTEASPGYDPVRGAAELKRLATLGTRWISLGPHGRQASLDARRIDFPDPGPYRVEEADLVQALRDAKARGFRVLWAPHLWITPELWRGDIRQRTEAAWEEWFAAYGAFLRHHAQLAAREQADMLSVGLELGGTIGREKEWRALIAEVRGIFPGPLTYAANWWHEVEAVPFWDALDRIGVQFFYPLASSTAATPGDLRAGLERIRAGLEAVAEAAGRPYLFTEVGYRSSPAPWVEPWVWRVALPEDEVDQALCLRLVVETFRDAPRFGGMFVWNWYLAPEQMRTVDRRFSPQGKRAEGVVGAAYGGAAVGQSTSQFEAEGEATGAPVPAAAPGGNR